MTAERTLRQPIRASSSWAARCAKHRSIFSELCSLPKEEPVILSPSLQTTNYEIPKYYAEHCSLRSELTFPALSCALDTYQG